MLKKNKPLNLVIKSNKKIEDTLATISTNIANYFKLSRSLSANNIIVDSPKDLVNIVGDKLYESYLAPQAEMMLSDAKEFAMNPYYHNLNMRDVLHKRLALKLNVYMKGEIMPFGNYDSPNCRMIPMLCYFNQNIGFYSLYEKEDMTSTVNPSVIYNSQSIIDKMYGDILILGVGMGYVPYMCSLKKDVNSITIVDNDKDLLDLFESQLLPQFPAVPITVKRNFPENIFEEALSNYDCIFVNRWSDPSALNMKQYIKYKRQELKSSASAKVYYFLEKELRYHMRTAFYTYLKLAYEQRGYKFTDDYANNDAFTIIKLYDDIFKEKGIDSINSFEDFASIIAREDEFINAFILKSEDIYINWFSFTG